MYGGGTDSRLSLSLPNPIIAGEVGIYTVADVTPTLLCHKDKDTAQGPQSLLVALLAFHCVFMA